MTNVYLYYFKYMLSRSEGQPDQTFIPIATTRPETILGDVAVAIQFSGHLRDDCRLAPAALHLSACRSRFASCHAFVHTWTELELKLAIARRFHDEVRFAAMNGGRALGAQMIQQGIHPYHRQHGWDPFEGTADAMDASA